MPERIFFQCSLPRVGSTLFQNLMNQDPRFYASANNGLLNLVASAKVNYDTSPEFKAQDADLMASAFGGFCMRSMHGFYNAITDRPYVLDKSRGNFAAYDMVHSFYPNPKIVCLVRDIPEIFCSVEKLFRGNQHKTSNMVNSARMRGTTTFKRVQLWMDTFQPMFENLERARQNGTSTKMLFIRYEDFCGDPETELHRFYDYLNIEYYHHDFSFIPRTIIENEEVYEFTGLFNLRSQLKMQSTDARKILGTDVISFIREHYTDYCRFFNYPN